MKAEDDGQRDQAARRDRHARPDRPAAKARPGRRRALRRTPLAPPSSSPSSSHPSPSSRVGGTASGTAAAAATHAGTGAEDRRRHRRQGRVGGVQGGGGGERGALGALGCAAHTRNGRLHAGRECGQLVVTGHIPRWRRLGLGRGGLAARRGGRRSGGSGDPRSATAAGKPPEGPATPSLPIVRVSLASSRVLRLGVLARLLAKHLRVVDRVNRSGALARVVAHRVLLGRRDVARGGTAARRRRRRRRGRRSAVLEEGVVGEELHRRLGGNGARCWVGCISKASPAVNAATAASCAGRFLPRRRAREIVSSAASRPARSCDTARTTRGVRRGVQAREVTATACGCGGGRKRDPSFRI